MNLELTEDNVSICHRLPKQNKDSQQPRTIIVKITRQVRETVYRAKAQLKSKNTGDLGLTHVNHNNIYINESLSQRNKDLFNKSLKVKRDLGFKYIWTNSGKIYLRKDNDFDARLIKFPEDLDDLCSP
jgi:hypothetical protein